MLQWFPIILRTDLTFPCLNGLQSTLWSVPTHLSNFIQYDFPFAHYPLAPQVLLLFLEYSNNPVYLKAFAIVAHFCTWN